jgi:hypothetical protein
VPGNLLSGLIQRGGDALYEALSRGVDDASERLEDFQRTMRRLLRVRQAEGNGEPELGADDLVGTARHRDWIAFTPPDLDQLVQRAIERVLKMLDLPTRSDIAALHDRLDRLADALGDRSLRRTERPPASAAREPAAHAPEGDPD